MRKTNNIKHSRPQGVDQIATILLLHAILFFVAASFVALITVGFSDYAVPVQTDLLPSILGLIGFFLVGAIFLAILSSEFRALKRWTYPVVAFIGTWSTLRTFRVFKDLRRADVRKAFGQSREIE